MPNLEHETLANDATLVAGVGKVHGIVWQTVANAAALAALVITATDVSQARVVYQTDTGQRWIPKTVGAGATFELLTQYPTGLRESSGPTNLNIGALANPSILTRVAGNIVAATFSAGLSLAAGVLTLAEVSNTTQGAITAITAANAVPLSNGGGTAATWTAISPSGSPVGTGRTISTTAPLSGGGDLSANRTLTVATVDNTSAGVAPITNASNGQFLISSATTVSWGTNIQAQNLTTSGILISSTATNVANVGTNFATTGSYRWQHGVNISGRNNANSTNRTIIDWGITATDNLHIGDGAVTMILNATSSGAGFNIRLNGTTRLTLSTSSLSLTVAQLTWDNSITPSIQPATLTTNGATAATLSITGANESGTTSTGGGIDIAGGTGTTAGGAVRLRDSTGNVRVNVNDTGLGFFTSAPVAKQSLTNTTGGVSANTLVDVTTTGVSDPVKVNANFASIWTKINNYGLWS